MKLSGAGLRNGGDVVGGVTTGSPPPATPILHREDDDTQTTADRIEILLEMEDQSSTSKQEDKGSNLGSSGSVSDVCLDGSSGVEVVSVPMAPLLSSDTNLTLSKTFGDEPVVAGGCRHDHMIQKAHTWNCQKADASQTASRCDLEVEAALDTSSPPLYKKFLGYVPITPRGFFQQEIKVIIDEAHATGGTPLKENRTSEKDKTTVPQATKESISQSVANDNDIIDDKGNKDITTGEDNNQALLRGTVRGEDIEFSPRFIGRKMNSIQPQPLSTEIDSVPTYDSRFGVIKEQFEATIDRSAPTKRKTWKSVAFGFGQSAPHNSITGNLKSILRLGVSEHQTTSSSASEESDRPVAGNQINEELIPAGPTAAAETQAESSRKEHSILFRRRVPSVTRPYADRASALEGVELVKQTFGSRQHSFLRSITFDEEPVGQRRSSDLIGSWMALRRSRSDCIGLKNEHGSDEHEPNENRSEHHATTDKKISLAQAGSHFDRTNSKASTSSSNDASVIVKEYFLPMDHGSVKSSIPSAVLTSKPVLGESTAANTEEMKVVPCPVVQSMPIKLPDKLQRKSSSTTTVDPAPSATRCHHMYHHVSPGSKKTVAGIRRLKKAAVELESSEMDRQIQEVAKARMRPNQSLQDAVEELEVELLEARKGKSREIRDLMFQRIRKQTQLRITDRGDNATQMTKGK